MAKKFMAELIGTMWLVLGGCGTAVLAGAHVGFAGVALAFGLTVLTMAFAVGHISGGHFNPAVTLGLVAAGRVKTTDLIPYWIAQIIGGVIGAAILFAILKCSDMPIGTFATNGYGVTSEAEPFGSPGGFSMVSALICEIIMTAVFIRVILGSTSPKAPAGFAPIAIGLCLTLIHLISIPVTNTSVNPARSISQAVFAQGDSLAQLWLFIVAPLAGALIAGLCYRYCGCDCDKESCSVDLEK